jgi:hypothetical protein
MPIVHVRGDRSKGTPAALGAIAEAVAEETGCSTGDVWCTYQQVTATVGKRPASILYVDLLARPRDGDVLQKALAAAARAASTSFGVALDDVWARLTVLESGTVFAGGGLL